MITPMKYTARFINGAAFKPTDWGDEGKPIIRIAQLTGKDFDNYFDGQVNPRYIIENNDLLFSWSATLDSFIWDRGPAILNQHIFKVEPFEGTHKRFLYYSLKHYSQIWADLDAHGSTMRHIKKDSLGNKIWFPNFDTQVAIADFLDRETSHIDRLIEKKRRQIELLREKEKSEISEIANRGIDHTEFSAMNEVPWRGQIPLKWKESRLKAHFRQSKRQGFEDLEVLSVYREFGVIKKSSRSDNNNKTPDDLSKYQLVEPGDLVINKMKAWQGSLGISKYRGIVSPDYVVMAPTHEHVSEYMHHLLRAKPMPSVYEQISNGIRLAQWRLEPYKFLCLPLFLPPLQEQKGLALAIGRALRRSRAAQKSINKSIDLLLEKRAALITAAVTGQLNLGAAPVSQSPVNDSLPLLVAAEIIRANQSTQRFGRVKFQKLLYLAEAHLGFNEIQGQYDREAAGPLDRALLSRLENELESKALYRAEATESGAIVYEAIGTTTVRRDEIKSALEDRAEPFFSMLNKLRDMKTKSVEAIATLFAVWNDALIDGQSPNDDFIINGVLNDWHPKKKDKFRADELQTWLDWMRRNDFVPKGQGPRTLLGRLLV